MPLNPFDLPGPPFLALYVVALLLALAASVILTDRARPDGREGGAPDVDALAYLAGGPARFADAVLARLLARGALAIDGKMLMPHAGEGGTPAECAVLAAKGPIRLSAAEYALAAHGERVAGRLVADGLMLEEADLRRMRGQATWPLALLLGIGAIKLAVGVARDRPVGFLVLLMAATAVIAAVRWARLDRRTRAGQRLLAREQARADRLRRAPTAPEMGLAVALFGTAVLAGSPHGAYHDLRRPSSDGGGSDGGDGGGDGGCGGGCGGD